MKKTAIFFLLLILSINSFSQGKLEQSKDELKSGSQSKETTSNSYHSSSYDDDDHFWFELIAHIFYFSAFGKYSSEGHLYNLYTPYPYFDEHSGNYTEPNDDSKSYTRFTIENNIYPMMQGVRANRLKGKINFRYFGFQGDWLQMKEDIQSSSLSIFNLSFCYDRLRFQRFNWGWNMGANFVGTGVNKFGFSIGTDAEGFLFKPVSLYGSAKWSWVNSQPIYQYEIRVKYYINRFYVSGGFESIRVASPRYNYITIGGGVCL